MILYSLQKKDKFCKKGSFMLLIRNVEYTPTSSGGLFTKDVNLLDAREEFLIFNIDLSMRLIL